MTLHDVISLTGPTVKYGMWVCGFVAYLCVLTRFGKNIKGNKVYFFFVLNCIILGKASSTL